MVVAGPRILARRRPMTRNRGQHGTGSLEPDTADNDPARFWRYVIAALDRACLGVGERAGPLPT